MPTQLLQDSAKRAQDALASLMESLESVHDNTEYRSVKLVIYFDEADELLEEISWKEKTFHSILLSVLNSFVSQPLFVLFLSTLLHVAPCPPPTTADLKLFSSARAFRCDGYQAPITETSFDCHPKLPIAPDTCDLREVSSLSFMAKFGRPLCVWLAL